MNCEKFTRNQSGNILVHCDRSDPNRTYKNQEIDHSKTYLNYNLAPEHTGMTDYEFMKKRCEEFKVLKRKDVNWLVSWVITMPTDYKGNKALFFREAYNFMANRYGKGNVVSAYVHLDETSPHMHFCFVPVIFDKKKQEYKVNAKQCINKVELKQIHPEMQEYLENKLQTKVNILNGATAEGNKTVEQLKNEEKIKEKQYHYGDLIEYPKLKKKGYILAVASSKPELYVRQILDHFGLTQYFTEIGGSEMDGRRTNKTEVIEDVLCRLNMDKHREQVIMIGDKEHDVYGARKAGLECIAVSFGYGTKEELTNAEPLKIVDSAEEIVNFFA